MTGARLERLIGLDDAMCLLGYDYGEILWSVRNGIIRTRWCYANRPGRYPGLIRSSVVELARAERQLRRERARARVR